MAVEIRSLRVSADFGASRYVAVKNQKITAARKG
jgi:hypothetical protein